MTEMGRQLKKFQEKKQFLTEKSLLQSSFPGKDIISKTTKRYDFLFSRIQVCCLSNLQLQVHMFEGLDYSVINEQISRFIPTSYTLFLVYTLIMNTQSFEKSSSSKKKFVEKIASHLSPFQGLKDKRLQRMNTNLFGYLQAPCLRQQIKRLL